MSLTIRIAQASDATEMISIYAPYVLETAITFDYDVPPASVFEQRILNNNGFYPWLVLCKDEHIVGYAYLSRFREKKAYDWVCESTIYTRADMHGTNAPFILYQTLLAIADLQGFYQIYAGITLPNPKSEKFHRKLGFEDMGIMRKIGYKFNRWHDIIWLVRSRQTDTNMQAPKACNHVETASAIASLLHSISFTN